MARQFGTHVLIVRGAGSLFLNPEAASLKRELAADPFTDADVNADKRG